jgi:undecaprenyl-diphosphatase
MIDYIVLGIIQGITEFLPVSSSGHLIFARSFISVQQDIVLDVLLHLATLLAIVVYYFRKIKNLTVSLFKSFTQKANSKDKENTRFITYIILATIPTVLIGFLVQDQIELVRNDTVVAIMLFIGGAVMLLDVALWQTREKYKKLNLKKSMIIGLIQPLALIPGTSRSGATIVAGSILGLSKQDAADFSFLLAVPAITGAFILQLMKVPDFSYFNNLNIWAAFITAFLVGIIAIKFLLAILNKWGFLPFAIYRIALAFLILLFFV